MIQLLIRSVIGLEKVPEPQQEQGGNSQSLRSCSLVIIVIIIIIEVINIVDMIFMIVIVNETEARKKLELVLGFSCK